MDFSYSEEDSLISCVEQESVLYDPGHEDYRNHYAKELAWKRIGQQLNKNSDDCKKKWKFIRDGYQRFKRRCRSKKGVPAPKNSKFKRHKKMSFLDKFPNARSGVQGYTLESSPTQSRSNSPQFETMDVKYCAESLEEQQETSEVIALDVGNTNNVEEVLEQKPKIECIIENPESLLDCMDQKTSEKQRKRPNRSKALRDKRNDDIDLFCRHIGRVLRNLPPVCRAKAKKNIGVMIADYEIKAAQMRGNKLPKKKEIDASSSSSSSSMSEYSSE